MGLTEFDIRNKPVHVSWEMIEFIERPPVGDKIIAIFKCKHCDKTIFRNQTFVDVGRFVDTVITNDAVWPYLCPMNGGFTATNHVDGYGCSHHSYLNVSSQFEYYVRDNLNFTEEQ